MYVILFFFNDTATTEIYTLSLHDALPISRAGKPAEAAKPDAALRRNRGLHEDLDRAKAGRGAQPADRSEEHTSELQSRQYLVCRLLLEKKQHQVTVRSRLRSKATPTRRER